MTRSDLFSLSIMPSKSIHVVANDKTSFFHMAKQYYIGCVCVCVCMGGCVFVSFSLNNIVCKKEPKDPLICSQGSAGEGRDCIPGD